MKRILIPALLLLASTTAHAKMFSVTELPTGPNTKLIFQLFDDAPMIAECGKSGQNGLLVDVESNGRMDRYGTGCWSAGMDGKITMLVKRWDDNGQTEFVIHNSYFSNVAD